MLRFFLVLGNYFLGIQNFFVFRRGGVFRVWNVLKCQTLGEGEVFRLELISRFSRGKVKLSFWRIWCHLIR